jgi:hypothetical protein
VWRFTQTYLFSSILTYYKYLNLVQYAETQGVAARVSATDMLKRSTKDSVKSMSKYKDGIAEANKIKDMFSFISS